jgi:hypothetical protein
MIDENAVVKAAIEADIPDYRAREVITAYLKAAPTGAKGEPGNWNGAKPVVDELARLRARVEALENALTLLVDDVDNLVSETKGVYGLHLNGDDSPWEEVLPGGLFERLSALEQARAALANAEAP